MKTARTLTLVLLVAAVAVPAWFGGRAYVGVKRDEARLALAGAEKPKALLELRAAEDARLHSGPVPIEEAMHRLATRGRGGLGAALTPEPSRDTAPLMGWAFQPHEVPAWMLADPATTDAGSE